MRLYENVLVHVENGVDGCLSQAAHLARTGSGRVTLIHVVQTFPSIVRRLYPGAGDLELVVRHEWSQRLEGHAARLRAEGLDVRTVLREGSIWMELVREVMRGGHDVLVKQATVEADEPEGWLGPVDMHLLRKCPSAVYLVRADAPATGRVLAAVDPAKEQMELNGRILRAAARMAQHLEGEARVLHVFEPVGHEFMRERTPEDDYRIYLQLAEREAFAATLTLLEEVHADIPPGAVHIEHGAPGRIIPAFTRHHEIELIVLGTLGRTGIAGYFIGNTAERILARVRCSVLAVKPYGFASPVQVPAA